MAVPDFDAGKGAQAAWNYCKTAKGKNGATGNPYKSKHMCVGVLWRTWQACGLDAVLQKHDCNNPSQYMAKLRGAGKSCYEEISTDNLNTPRYGDVALYHGGKTVGHGCIYLPMGAISENNERGGDRWVSDFVQNGWNVYPGSGARDVCCFRYRGNVVYNGQSYGAQASGAPMSGGGGGGPAAPMKDFNVKEFEVKEDENGQYTEESPLMGIANHIHIGGAGGSGGGSMAAGPTGEEGVFTELATGPYADGLYKLRKKDVQERAVYCAKWCASNITNFNLMYACAVIGVYVDENGCDPHEGMELEKAGRGSAYTKGGGYGAGIGSWTGKSSKDNKLRMIGKDPATTKIEDLSLDEQLQITKKEWESGDKFHKVMWQAKDLVHASIVATYLTHGSGYFQKALDAGGWDIYSQGFINAMNQEARDQLNRLQNQFHGDSPYYHGLFHKRYLVAKALMGMCGG